MGKLGYIGWKMVVIFVFIGMLLFFMYLGEVGYGDLGMLVVGDVLIVILNLGKSDEIMMLMFLIKYLGVFLIIISGDECGLML